MQNFKERMEDHQIEYKTKVLGIKQMGRWRGKPYPHILPEDSWSLNLWEGISYEAIRYFAQKEIAWHNQKHNLVSGQILCVNLFFPLRQHFNILEAWLSRYFNDLGKVIDLDFEYIGPPDTKDPSGYRNYFKETGGRGQNRSSADISIVWQDRAKRMNMLLLEFKFTEPDFGQCSKQGNPNPNRCFSREYQTECYRTEVGRPYWEMILSNGSPFRNEIVTNRNSCPFRYHFYQLMRNQLLAHCIQSDPEEDFKRVEFGVIYHADNEVLTRMPRPFEGEHNPLKAWPNLLNNPNTFHVFTVQDFLNTIEPKLHGELINWRVYLKQRYDL